jgi:hypothetical protein
MRARKIRHARIYRPSVPKRIATAAKNAMLRNA